MDTTGMHSPHGFISLAVSDGREALLSARGDFDRDNRSSLIAAIESAFVDGHTAVVLDFAGVTFIDAAVVNALVNCEEDARGQGRVLRLVNPGSVVAHILIATGTFTVLCGSRRGGDGATMRPPARMSPARASSARTEAVIARAHEVLIASRRLVQHVRDL